MLNQALSRAGYEVRSTGNCATLWRWVAQGEGDLVITDVVMPDENVFDLLPRIKRVRPELPVIVMSAQNTFMTAIRASERGAYEYLPKPFDLKELIAIVGRALSRPRGTAAAASAPDNEDIPLVGRSPAMQEIYRALARLMPTDLTVMITGESGTGKELVARALHDYGRRRTGPFVPVNMAAIPRDLIESELFGHEKGAFTGALQRSAGRFEQAEGGTLFLDEIGDMPMEAQTRLLRVLQQGEYTTVGGRVPIKTNVRIIAATNKDLRISIQQGIFREDLFFRLNVVPLRLPALRERSEDVPDLVRHFFVMVEREGLTRKTLDGEAMERMKRYRWPGNVRELENLVRRLAALYPQEDHHRTGDRGRARHPSARPSGLGRRQRRRAQGRFRGREPLDRGRAPPLGLLLGLSRHPAAAGPLPPRAARDRGPADRRGAGRHPRQPDPRGGTPRCQPQHPAQEGPRPRPAGLPHRALRRTAVDVDSLAIGRWQARMRAAARAADALDRSRSRDAGI